MSATMTDLFGGKPRPYEGYRRRSSGRMTRFFVCGTTADWDGTTPNVTHKRQHIARNETACGLSEAQASHYHAIRWAASKGKTLPVNWEPPEPVIYVCSDNPDDREKPDVNHYQRDRLLGKICAKSRAERAWARAEAKAKKPLPDWKPVEYVEEYECGDFADAVSPGSGHASRHISNGEECCGKSRAERAWAKEEWTQKRKIVDYEFRPREPHTCGDATEYQEPSARGYQYHRNRNEECCPKSIIEARWAKAVRKAGKPLPDWTPPQPRVFVCGEAHEAEEASWAHQGHHRDRNEFVCFKARREAAWATYQNDTGKIVERYEPNKVLDYNVATWLYVRKFLDGDYYWGLTAMKPAKRWRRQLIETTPVGQKLQTGAVHASAAVVVCPDRWQTSDLERIAIQTGPLDLLLNIEHTANQTALSNNDLRTGLWLNGLPLADDLIYVVTNQLDDRWRIVENGSGGQQFRMKEAKRIADHLREHNRPPDDMKLADIPD